MFVKFKHSLLKFLRLEKLVQAKGNVIILFKAQVSEIPPHMLLSHISILNKWASCHESGHHVMNHCKIIGI